MGPHTREPIGAVLATGPIPEQYFTHCQGIFGPRQKLHRGYFGTGGRTCAPGQGADRESREDFLWGDVPDRPWKYPRRGLFIRRLKKGDPGCCY